MKSTLKLRLIIMLFLTFCLNCVASNCENFIRAIHQVETGGRLGAIRGDNGRALGPLQIHFRCWKDSRVKGKYSQCADLKYSKLVICGYLNRYCPDAVKKNDFEAMARVWNSGPNWRNKKQSTNSYWAKVKKVIAQGANERLVDNLASLK